MGKSELSELVQEITSIIEDDSKMVICSEKGNSDLESIKFFKHFEPLSNRLDELIRSVPAWTVEKSMRVFPDSASNTSYIRFEIVIRGL